MLIVCNNQVRTNLDTNPWAKNTRHPAVCRSAFTQSLRLRCHTPHQDQPQASRGKGKLKRVIGVKTQVKVYKSSVWQPYHAAPVSIIYDYDLDNVPGNLEYVKATTGATTYHLGKQNLGDSLSAQSAR